MPKNKGRDYDLSTGLAAGLPAGLPADVQGKTGQLLIDEGFVSPEDIDQVLAIQEKHRTSLGRNRAKLFGMVLCDLNLITPMDNYCTLEKHDKLISIQEFLIRKNIVPRPRIEQVEARGHTKDIPFISLLLEEGVVQKTLLQQILFDLFHIPFRSVGDVVFDKSLRQDLTLVVPQQQARKEKIIPLQLTGNTLLVGITEPSNLIFLQNLDKKFPQYRFTPVFIPFSGFTWFYKLLYKEDWISLGSMKFSITITDPEREKETILSLYDRYERIRKGFQAKINDHNQRENQFIAFVSQHHARLSRKFQCRAIKFSLKAENNQLRVMALPREETP